MNRQDVIKAVKAAAEPVYGEREAGAIARLVAEKLTPERLRRFAAESGDSGDGALVRLSREIAASRPVQYILGVADFYDLELAVGEGVLVPRPETEELVRWIVKSEAGAKNILDIGTGSGAIAIALAVNLPGAKVTGVDISADALGFARRNNEKYGAGVEFFEADALCLGEDFGSQKFNVIVSNPPYIPSAEQAAMHDNVVRYEPATALFVPDDDPLVFYRAIARFARRALTPTGALYFEIHEAMGRAIAELLQAENFHNIEVRQDINSKPRMVRCEL